MNLRIIEERLRREHNLPDDFYFYRWESHGPPGESWGTTFEGRECPLFKSGPRKGKPNYRAGGPPRTFQVGTQTAKDWIAQWVHRTGSCEHCYATGRRIVRTGVNGSEYAVCRRCNGTGKHQEATPCP